MMIMSTGVRGLNMLRNSPKVQFLVNHRNFLLKNNQQPKNLIMCTRKFSRSARTIHQRVSPQSSLLLSNQFVRGFRSRTAKPSHKLAPNARSNQDVFVILKYGALTHGFIMLLYGGLGISQYYKNQKEGKFFWTDAFGKNDSSKFRVYIDNKAMDTNLLKLLASNFAVFLLWKVSSLEAFMSRWFSLSAVEGIRNVPSMLLNGFSHKFFLHFMINMYVLKGFMQPWQNREPSQKLEGLSRFEMFFPFYLSALSYASLISLVTKILTRQAIPSLGASGAIMALLSYACCKYPHSKLSLVFIPNWTFSAESGLYGILMFDLIGVLTMLFRAYLSFSSPFDHAGHLGGLLFGMLYAKYLEDKLFLPWVRAVSENWKNFMEPKNITINKKDPKNTNKNED